MKIIQTPVQGSRALHKKDHGGNKDGRPGTESRIPLRLHSPGQPRASRRIQ